MGSSGNRGHSPINGVEISLCEVTRDNWQGVAGKAEARIALAFDRPTGGRVGLGELSVEVRE